MLYRLPEIEPVPNNIGNIFNVGDKVMTPHGSGVVIGFESFDKHGLTLPPSNTDTGGRVIVGLDNPDNCLVKQPHYFRKSLESC